MSADLMMSTMAIIWQQTRVADVATDVLGITEAKWWEYH